MRVNLHHFPTFKSTLQQGLSHPFTVRFFFLTDQAQCEGINYWRSLGLKHLDLFHMLSKKYYKNVPFNYFTTKMMVQLNTNAVKAL